jgi:hypothetical protein
MRGSVNMRNGEGEGVEKGSASSVEVIPVGDEAAGGGRWRASGLLVGETRVSFWGPRQFQVDGAVGVGFRSRARRKLLQAARAETAAQGDGFLQIDRQTHTQTLQ